MEPAGLLQKDSHELFAACADKADVRSGLQNLLTRGSCKCAQLSELFGQGLSKWFAERSPGTERRSPTAEHRVVFLPFPTASAGFLLLQEGVQGAPTPALPEGNTSQEVPGKLSSCKAAGAEHRAAVVAFSS